MQHSQRSVNGIKIALSAYLKWSLFFGKRWSNCKHSHEIRSKQFSSNIQLVCKCWQKWPT